MDKDNKKTTPKTTTNTPKKDVAKVNKKKPFFRNKKNTHPTHNNKTSIANNDSNNRKDTVRPEIKPEMKKKHPHNAKKGKLSFLIPKWKVINPIKFPPMTAFRRKKYEEEVLSHLDLESMYMDSIKEQSSSSASTVVTAHTSCSICKEPITNALDGIFHPLSGKLAHFDCCLNDLKELLKDKVKAPAYISYIGNGKFAIVENKFNKQSKKKVFTILQIIEKPKPKEEKSEKEVNKKEKQTKEKQKVNDKKN